MVSVALVLCPNPILSTPSMYPNLGLMYLAAMLERQGITPHIVDMRRLKGVDVGLIPMDVEFVGISATSGEIDYARSLAWELRRRAQNHRTPHIIIGGAHASLMPEDCEGDFDTVVVGEGEEVLPAIIAEHIKGKVISPRIKNLDLLPFPARHLFDCFSTSLFPGEKYGEGQKATTILWTRGCPFTCKFCANIYHTVTYRSSANIKAEMEHLIRDFDCRAFRLEDDNLGVNISWFNAVCEALPKDIRLKGHVRANLVNDTLCKILVKAGFEECGVGVESMDDRVLKLIGKGTTAEDNYRAVETLKRHGLRVRVYFMSGLPGETEETVQKNMTFMCRAKPDKWTLSFMILYPGCEIRENPDKFGMVLPPSPGRAFQYWNFAPASIALKDASREVLQERHDRFKQFLVKEEWRS